MLKKKISLSISFQSPLPSSCPNNKTLLRVFLFFFFFPVFVSLVAFIACGMRCYSSLNLSFESVRWALLYATVGVGLLTQGKIDPACGAQTLRRHSHSHCSRLSRYLCSRSGPPLLLFPASPPHFFFPFFLMMILINDEPSPWRFPLSLKETSSPPFSCVCADPQHDMAENRSLL